MPLGDSIDIAAFLEGYWQQKPLLIPGALPGFDDFLTPEELAGLACEEEVESRLVFDTAAGWEMKHGPFAERDFTFLAQENWTLLVQSVDHWLPELKALLQEVSFIPGWRLDDVMVSYAARGGGVGPHFDHYDVFLVQGRGSRQWQLGPHCDSSTPLHTDSGLKILQEFTPVETVELRQGDILYIPAGLAHQGTAIEAGLCYSIGFRAPDLSELLAACSEAAGQSAGADIRYRDPAPETGLHPGEISMAALQQVKVLLEHAVNDDQLLLRSFGCLMTEPRLPDLLVSPDTEVTPEQMAVILQKGAVLVRHPVTRFACHHTGESLTLFVNGECLELTPVNDKLSGLNDELQDAIGRPLNLKPFQRNEGCLNLLARLYNQGCLIHGSRR